MTGNATKKFFLERVEAYCEKTGMSENALARNAINTEGTHGYFNRVRDNDRTSLKSIMRVDAFMEAHPDGFNPLE